MNPLSSIGRVDAVAGIDGASTLSGPNRAGGVSFGKSLEYVIGTSPADHQRHNGGNGGQAGNMRGLQGAYGGMQWPGSRGLHTNDQQVTAILSPPMGAVFKTVKSMDQGMQPANTQRMGVQEKSQPLTSGLAASRTDPNAASGNMTQQPQGTTESQPQKSANYGDGTQAGYQFDSVPSTLDPGSMAFLLAWLGGGGPAVGGQSIRQQQESYLDNYRQRYPNGVPGVNNYITSTTKYLTGTA